MTTSQPITDAQTKDALEQAQLLLDLMRESCRPSPYFHTPKKEEKL